MSDQFHWIHYLGKEGISESDFRSLALARFRIQYDQNPLYRKYVDTLGKNPRSIKELEAIPFLPVSFFRTHKLICPPDPSTVFYFESSGTSELPRSRHYIRNLDLYHEAIDYGFRSQFGNPEEIVFLALLPSYIERKNASLVYMCQYLMNQSRFPENGFYLDQWQELAHLLASLKGSGRKIMLIGVTFALLDFAEAYPQDLGDFMVMETGGMKGRKKEWTRTAVHDYLKDRFQLSQVYSEYGMTELLSQAYAKRNGVFRPGPSLFPLVREINDPFHIQREGTGCLNFIDLANVHSCSFIATDDIGQLKNGEFEVLGRLDHSALRGCSLLTA